MDDLHYTTVNYNTVERKSIFSSECCVRYNNMYFIFPFLFNFPSIVIVFLSLNCKQDTIIY